MDYREGQIVEIARILSPSYKEDAMQDYIIDHLEDMKIDHFFDDYDNIHVNADSYSKVGVCAHMDHVTQSGKPEPCVDLSNGRIASMSSQSCGWDDKAGILLALWVLQAHPDTHMIFTAAEEVGCVGSGLVETDDWLASDFWIIPDRRGIGEIVYEGWTSRYSSLAVASQMASILRPLSLSPSIHGSLSDCDSICEFRPSVNLSAGYFNAHTAKEQLDWKYLLNLTDCIISSWDKINEVEWLSLDRGRDPFKMKLSRISGMAKGWHSQDSFDFDRDDREAEWNKLFDETHYSSYKEFDCISCGDTFNANGCLVSESVMIGEFLVCEDCYHDLMPEDSASGACK